MRGTKSNRSFVVGVTQKRNGALLEVAEGTYGRVPAWISRVYSVSTILPTMEKI